MEIKLVKHDPEWKALFKAQAKEIKGALGKDCLALCHIGSTAVKDIPARPIIDILMVVNSFAALDEKTEALIKLGYERSESVPDGMQVYNKQGELAYKIIAFEKTNQTEIARRVAVRNYLRAYPAVAKEFAERKTEIAEQILDFRDYFGERDAFMDQLEREALAWQKRQDKQSNGLAFGLTLGAGIGVFLGLALNNLALGVGLGMCIGVCFGTVISSWDNQGKTK